MFQSFRNQKRWLMLIAMILIIPAFVFIGINGYSRLNPDANAIAKIDGKGIQPEEFDQAKRNYIERIRNQQGGNIDTSAFDTPEANAAVLYNLITDRALTAQLNRNYIQVSEADAINVIKQADAFKKDGQFNSELYENFLAARGKSDQQFVYELRGDLARELLINSITRTVNVPQKSVEYLNNALREERVVRTLTFNPASYKDQVKVTDEQVQSYYDKNKDLFKVPQNLDIEYVVFSPDSLTVKTTPSQDVLKQFYEQNKLKFGQDETRRASHILVSVESADKDAEAKAKIEKLLAEVKADPSKFAEVAKANSDDTGSAQDGGDLDFFAKGQMVPEFEKAVFEAKKGDIVGPVKTEYGYHIIHVTDISPAHAKTFEEVEPEITQMWKNQQKAAEFAENADNFTNMVYEQSDSLAPVVEKFGLKLHKVSGLTEKGFMNAKDNVAEINKRMITELFSSDCLNEKRNTQAVEVAANTLVSARVVKNNPEHIKPFDEVKAEIKETLEWQEASKLAKAAGEAKLAQLKAKSDLEGFSKEQTVSRANPDGQSAEVVSAELSVPVKSLPAYTGASSQSGDYVISYVISNKMPVNDDDTVKEIRNELTQADSMGEEIAYYDALRQVHNLEILKKEFDYKLPKAMQ